MLTNVQLADLVKKGKESKERKFAESFESVITFKDVDPKKTDLNINETLYLPHPGSHKSTICFIGSGDLLLRAKNAGVEGTLEPSQLENFSGNKKEAKKLARQYDFFLADTALMPRIGKLLGTSLGPKGKIPTPPSLWRTGRSDMNLKKRPILPVNREEQGSSRMGCFFRPAFIWGRPKARK